MSTDVHEVKGQLASGLLSFPVTPFDAGLELDEATYGEHVGWLADYGPAGLFVAGGTGEFFSLSTEEVQRAVTVAIEVAGGKVPIVAPAGLGTVEAVAMARSGQRAGADAIFLLPPYLTEAPQRGLVEHVKAVCSSTDLGVIVYHRANAEFTADSVEALAEACPNFVGFKDGIGDVELMACLNARLGDRLLYLAGLPTAEVFAPAYFEIGSDTYSSAIFNFIPEFAMAFFVAAKGRDHDFVRRAMQEFFNPYLDIRNRTAGYAVSIVKAGMDVVGRPAGGVRPPLTRLADEEVEQLAQLIKQAQALL